MIRKPKLCRSSEKVTRKTSGVNSSHEERESLLFFWIKIQMPLPVFVEKKDLYLPRVRRCLFSKLRNEFIFVRCSRKMYISAKVHVTALNLTLKSMSELTLRPRMFTHLTINSVLDFVCFARDVCKKSVFFSIFVVSANFVSRIEPGFLADF